MSVGQFIGLLTRSPTLCHYTNITSTHPQDLYLVVLQECEKILNQQFDIFLKPLIKILYPKNTIEDLFEGILVFPQDSENPLTIYGEIINYLREDFASLKQKLDATSHLCKHIARELLVLHNAQLLSDFSKISNTPLTGTIFTTFSNIPEKKLIKYTKKKLSLNFLTLVSYMKTLHCFFRLYFTIKSFPFKILERKVIKALVMPDAYNAGKKSRLMALTDYYYDNFCMLGYSKVPAASINFVAQHVNEIYTYSTKTTLVDIAQFKKLCKYYINQYLTKNPSGPGITISMPFVIWEMHKYLVTKELRCRLPVKGSTVHFRIFTKSNLLDKEKMSTAFSPIYIHSLDATAVHFGYEFQHKVNTYINEHQLKLPYLWLVYNHDSCGIAAKDAVLLSYIVANCYNKIVDEAFISEFKNFNEVYEKIVKRPQLRCISLENFLKY